MTDYTSILPDGKQLQIALSHPEVRQVLRISQDGAVEIGQDYGADEREVYNVDLVYDIARKADATALRSGLAEGGAISVLIDRVIAGHDSEWDGRRSRGTFTKDAQEAHDDLRDMLDRLPLSDVTVWSAAEWLIGTDHPANVQIDGATAEDLIAEADRAGDLIWNGLDGMRAALAEVLAAKAAREENDEAA